jgi:hypothetical protein
LAASGGQLIAPEYPHKQAEVLMKEADKPAKQDSHEEDSTEFNRAPRQKTEHRNPVESAEKTKDIPTKHGALK